ncbi:MAG: family 10 glycosylhydrolase [Bacteroidia bacterium]
MGELLRLFTFATSVFLACSPSDTHPKHEFRAVWVASFHNIDWPSARGLSSEDQQAEFLSLLKSQQQNGMNALVVQVRPCGDAFYPSSLAPWSEWITGTQGRAPEPYYDPLAFMLDETHKANMEFHAWLNPFRAVSHQRFSSVDSSNLVNKKPEWFFQYGQKTFFNPGIPAVRDYLTGVVMEIVKNYDIDGIHFDDYFYPYKEDGMEIPDQQTFQVYGSGFSDIGEWRRNNINLFVEQVSLAIRKEKPFVKFGISPMGIWRNKSSDPRGSDTRVSQTSYDALYADVHKWLELHWIDYAAPQLYWGTEHPSASYAELLPWWAENSYGRHVYIGQAMFKVKNGQSRYWDNPSQLILQLKLNKAHPEIKGSIFYSASSFTNNPYPVKETLRNDFYRYPAMIPAMTWKDSIPPLAPPSLTAWEESGKVILTWQPSAPAEDKETPRYYVIYRFSSKEKVDMNDPSHIITITKATNYIDATADANQAYTYLVTAVDRMHNESRSCAAVMVKTLIAASGSLPPQVGESLQLQQEGSFDETLKKRLRKEIPAITPLMRRTSHILPESMIQEKNGPMTFRGIQP